MTCLRVFLLTSLLGSVVLAPNAFELGCQPPSRWIRVAHLQDVSPDMTDYINAMKNGAADGFDDWMHQQFENGAVSAIINFTNKQFVTGDVNDVCQVTYRSFDSSPLLPSYQLMPTNVGAGSPERSVMDAMWAAVKMDWDTPLDKGRRIVIVYTSQMPQIPPTADVPPFDLSTNCEAVDYPDFATVVAALDSVGIHVVFVVPEDKIAGYQALASAYDDAVVIRASTDPIAQLDSLFAAMNLVYCGIEPPTQGPDASTPIVISTTGPDDSTPIVITFSTTDQPPLSTTEVPCTEDAILQLLHLQDVSWSYTNDLANMKAKFPDLLNDLKGAFFKREVALGTFSDKPMDPVGYWGDYCYREDVVFTTDEAVFIAGLDDARILSGRDWKESQYDAVMDGITSTTLGWKTVDEIDGRQVLKVVMLATDAGPHVKGHMSSLPSDHPDGCEYRDYPAPSALGAALDASNVYPIFVVTSDIYNYWVRKAAEVTNNAKVLHLSQTSEDLFAAIEAALRDICEGNRRRLSAAAQ